MTSAGGGRPARRAVRRWSWRLLRREWRQQLLVIVLLTVAVGAAVLAAVAAYNVVPSRDAEFGTADVRFEYSVSEAEAVDPYVDAARRWFGTVEAIGRRVVAVPGSTAAIELRGQEPDGPLAGPMLALRSGRLPTVADEVALTDAAADLLGADIDIDDEVVLGDVRVTVVGTVENPADLDDEFALVTGGAGGPIEHLTLLARGDDERARTFRPDREPGTGFFETRGQTEGTTAALLVLAVASVAMVLVSLVAGAAFVTLAHRRQRQLGLLAAVGATPRQLRRAMVANGAAVGAVAAVLGTGAALLAWIVVAPALEAPAGHRIDRLDIPLWVPAAGIVLAILTASLAAWWPARAVARVPVTEAISARPPAPRQVRRPLVIAMLLLGLGITGIALGIDPNSEEVSAPLLLGGLVATVAATVLLAAPALRAVALVAGRLPLATRLSVRDLARFQARSAAALGAITMGVAIAVAIVVIAAAAVPSADGGNLSDRQLMAWSAEHGDIAGDLSVPIGSATDLARGEGAVAEMAAVVGEVAVVPVDAAADPTIPEVQGGHTFLPTAHVGRPVGQRTIRDIGTAFVATPAILDHLGIDPKAVDGDILVLTTQPGPIYISGNISSTTYRRNPVPDPQVARVEIGAYTSTPRHLLTPLGLDAAGLVDVRVGWLLEADAPFAPEDLDRIRDIAVDAGLSVEVRDDHASLTTLRTAASIAGVAVALSILALTIGLLRSGAAQDVRTLTASGATRRTRRAVTASTAGALAIVGAILGTGMAYAALIAGYWPETDRLAPVPVGHLLVIAVGLPLVAGLTSWLISGRTPASLRPQVD